MKKTMWCMLLAAGLCTALAGANTVMAEEDQSLGKKVSSLFGEDGKLGWLLGEDGAAVGLFGKDGALGQYVPEGIDVEGIVGELSQQLSDENSELYQTVEGVAGMVVNEDGSLNAESIADLAESLLGSTLNPESGAEGELEDMDAYFLNDAELQAAQDYVVEMHKETMQAGDAEIVSSQVPGFVRNEDGSVAALIGFLQDNFTREGNDLSLCDEREEIVLVSMIPDENGGYTVTDAQFLEEGEGAEVQLEQMCQAVGITVDGFYGYMTSYDSQMGYAIKSYMDANPDVEHVEFQGQMMDSAELEQWISDYLDEMLAALFGEYGIEGMTEAMTESITEAITE